MFNVLVVGCGNKGATADEPGTPNSHKFLSYAHAIKESSHFAISEFYDINAEHTRHAYDIWGEGNGKHIDIGIIATPDDEHYNNLKAMATLGLKLVIVEKPLCKTVEQAREIVELYERKGIPILCDYTRRFIPRFREAYDQIDQGIFGKFIKGYLYFNRGWEHTASHFIDHALWYNGDLKNIEIHEVEPCYRWVYQWGLFYEHDFVSEHAVNLKHAKVDTIYDNHLKYVMDNAYGFLQREEPLFCDGEDALRALEETIRIKAMSDGYSIDKI